MSDQSIFRFGMVVRLSGRHLADILTLSNFPTVLHGVSRLTISSTRRKW